MTFLFAGRLDIGAGHFRSDLETWAVQLCFNERTTFGFAQA